MSKFVADRLWLNERLEIASMKPANDNNPSKTEDEVKARRESVGPSKTYRKLSAQLRSRQSIGNPRADNDNQAWPLAEQLRRDGNEALLSVAERYRTVYEAAMYEPRLVGNQPDDFWSPEQNHSINQKTGKLKLNGQKRSKTAAAMPVDDGTFKVVSVTDEAWEQMVEAGPVTFPRRPKMQMLRKWNGDAVLIAAIDAKPMLARLQVALGPLLDVFEDAVISGMTFTDIGRTGGIGQHAAGAGKFAVMLGLQTVQEEFRRIDLENAA